MKRPLVVIGAGETANLANEYFNYDSDYEVVAFAVDASYRSASRYCGRPVIDLEKLSDEFPPSEVSAFVALGSGELNYQRSRMYARVKDLGYALASYVSSRAFVWRNVEIGDNCFILEDNTLQPFTRVGNDVVMWSGNHLGHQSVIGDHCFVTSHVVISGFCTVGHHSFVGVNSSIADHASIGGDNFVAMGTTISGETGADEVWRGHPGRRMAISAKVFCGVKL